MKIFPLVIAIGAVIVISGLVVMNINKSTPSSSGEKMQENSIPTVSPTISSDSAIPEEARQESGRRYIAYSKQAFDAAKGKKRVLYFHAVWCPFCRVADEEFENNLDKISNNVLLFKTDYDTEHELKQKYGITYQHTFVYVDDNDDPIKIWNGGALKELIENTQ